MYLNKMRKKHQSGRLHVFAWVLGLVVAGSCLDQANAQESTMKYANGNNWLAAPAKFELLAADGDALDDCDTPLPVAAAPTTAPAPAVAASAPAQNQDVILLSKLEPNEKSRAIVTSAAKGQSRPTSATGANASATAAKNVEVLPVSAPQSPVPQQTWDIIVSDKTLNAAMSRWAAKAGWQLLWELPVDYAVDAKTTVYGSFEEAVGTVAKSMESAEIPMKAMFYQGNKVLRIMAKGAE